MSGAMSWNALSTIVRHGVRNVRHGGIPFLFATTMTALGLFGVAVFATVLVNFARLADAVGTSVGAVCFLAVDDAARAEEVRADIAALPGVDAAVLVTPEAALARAKRALGESGAALEGTAGVRMPWVVETSYAPGDGVALPTLLAALERQPGVDDVMHPSDDVARVNALLRVLEGAGVFLAILVALVTLVVVSNAVKLTMFARREEIAIMKLVGATDAFVRAPFIIEGLVSGLIAAALALAALVLAHTTLKGVLEVALSGALGAFTLAPLPTEAALLIVVAGASLGVFGAAFSIGRFLRV
jgi:cell division transport system permease protein